MDSPTIVPVVLSGGAGTRLWPASRHQTPKQLRALVDERTLLAATLDRLVGMPGLGRGMVVCNEDHAAAVRREVRRSGQGDAAVVLEPVGRNTAPAVAVAAFLADDDPLLLVMPADHVISDVDEFKRTVGVGAEAATTDALVTFGIVPTFPATGYGYIRAEGEGEARPVTSFVEKPDEETAAEFLASGEYLWNSGIFMFRASRYLDELARFEPDIVAAVGAAVAAATVDGGSLRLDLDAFSRSPSISIDYAVMERTDRAVVVSFGAGWSDVGSWASLRQIGDTDDAGNLVAGDVVMLDVTDSYLRSDGPLLAALGLSGIVAVATGDAVLVADESRVEEVKTIVEELRRSGRREADEGGHRTFDWGSSQVLARHDGGVVEQVVIDEGSSMTAHPGTWVVVSGGGVCGEQMLRPGVTVDVGGDPVSFVAGDDDPLVLVAVTPEPPSAG